MFKKKISNSVRMAAFIAGIAFSAADSAALHLPMGVFIAVIGGILIVSYGVGLMLHKAAKQ